MLSCAGCASLPPPSASLPQQLDAYAQRRLEPKAGAWDLDELTQAAWRFDAELRAQWRQIQQAEAEQAQAGRRPNPELHLDFERSRDADASPWTLGAGLDFTVEAGGKSALRAARAQCDVEAAALALAERAEQVRAQVRAARIELDQRERAEALAQAQAGVQLARARLWQQRWQRGAARRSDWQRAETEAQAAASEQARAAAETAGARRELAAALSVPASALQAIALAPLPALPETNPLAAHSTADAALAQRTDFALALLDYRRADLDLRLQFAQRWPDLSLGPGLIFDQGAHKFALATAMLAPLFDRHDAAITAAWAAREAAAQRAVATQAQALAAIEQAQAQGDAAWATLQRARHALSLAQEGQGSAQRRWQAGADDRAAWLDAQAMALSAEQQALAAETQWWQALAELERQQGQPRWPLSHLARPTAADFKEDTR